MVPKSSLLLLLFAQSQAQKLYYPGDEELSKSSSTYIQNSHSSYTNNDVTTKTITNGIVDLSLKISKEISDNHSHQNAVFSPIGISAALALVLLGSSARAFDELADLLLSKTTFNKHEIHEKYGQIIDYIQIISNSSSDPSVVFATGMFLQNDLKIRSSYQHIVENVYKSEIFSVNFKENPIDAQNTINNWVRNKTKKKIDRILPDPPLPSTKIVICNAIYFQKQWEKPFLTGLTQRKPFFRNGRAQASTSLIEMMSNGGDFPYYKDLDLNCEILGLPYKGNNFVMYIIIPSNSSKKRLKEFQNQLTHNEINNLMDKVVYRKVAMLFPKMKLKSEFSLKRALQNLGVRTIFNKVEGNLNLLSSETFPFEENLEVGQGKYNVKNTGLYVDEIRHSVDITVSESGTEAAASTSVSISRGGDLVLFRADVPFLFVIREEDTKAILFWGSIYDPAR